MLVGMLLINFFQPSGIGGSTIVVIAVFGIMGYFYAKQDVWVTLSDQGIRATGYTGREIRIPWEAMITVNAARKYDMDGIELRLSENDNFLKKQVLSLFIPRAIANSNEFATTVAKLAPVDHPLRKLSDNAP